MWSRLDKSTEMWYNRYTEDKMTSDDKLNLFRKYLQRRLSHVKMLLTVAESANQDSQVIEIFRLQRDNLTDIIHDFDMLVKSDG